MADAYLFASAFQTGCLLPMTSLMTITREKNNLQSSDLQVNLSSHQHAPPPKGSFIGLNRSKRGLAPFMTRLAETRKLPILGSYKNKRGSEINSPLSFSLSLALIHKTWH